MPGNTSKSADFGTIRSRSTNEMETYKELTEQARAFPQLQRGRPSATVRACANESLKPRAEGAARPSTLVVPKRKLHDLVQYGAEALTREARAASYPVYVEFGF